MLIVVVERACVGSWGELEWEGRTGGQLGIVKYWKGKGRVVEVLDR